MIPPDFPRGTVTFLFSDIETSGDLRDQLGHEWDDVVRLQDEVFRDALESASATEPRADGDTYFVVFASAVDAVASATHIQRRFANQEWPGGVDVRRRIGLHTGEAHIEDGEYEGTDVRRAERIARSAHGGQVVMSAVTAALNERVLPPFAKLRDHGSHELKDLAFPEHLYQLVIDGLQESFPPLRTLSSQRTNLPPSSPGFVGRGDDVATVVKAVGQNRMVSVVGAAGVGKTAVAEAAGRSLVDSFRDGVWLVEVFRAGDEDLIASVVAKELAITEGGPLALADQIESRLQRAEMLIILDGCEHLVDGVGRFVQSLLGAAPHVHVLVTSREILSLEAETVVRLPPLGIPPAGTVSAEAAREYDAVKLFVDRATEANPTFELTDANAALVAEIGRRLDGLPLAIELTAAQLGDSTLTQVVERLDRTTASSRSATAGPQLSLEDTLASSHETLSSEERLLFARLGVFVGGMSSEAAQQVCSAPPLDPDAIPALLERLEDTSLIVAVSAEPNRRYRLLEPIAQYARSRLAQTEGLDEIQRRHAAFFLEVAEAADGQLRGPQQTEWAATLERERYNLRAALRWSRVLDPETSVRLAGALRWFWVIQRDLTEGTIYLRNALADRGRASPDAVARAYNGLALLAFRALDLETAEQALHDALALHEQRGDTEGVARQIYHQGVLAWFRDDHQGADALLARAQELTAEVGDTWYLAWTLALRGSIARLNDDFESAGELLARSTELFEGVGGTIDRGWAELRLGALARDRGSYEEATEHYSAGRVLLADHGDEIGLAHADAGLGAIGWLKGNRKQALAKFQNVLEAFGAPDEAADNLFELKMMIQGNPSVEELRQVTQWNVERAAFEMDLGVKAALGEYLYHLGKTAFRGSQHDRAQAALLESLELCRDAGDYRGAAVALIGLGCSIAADGDAERALVLYGAASAVAESDGLDPWPPENEPDYHRYISEAREELDAVVAEQAWAHGVSLDLSDVAEIARNNEGQP